MRLVVESDDTVSKAVGGSVTDMTAMHDFPSRKKEGIIKTGWNSDSTIVAEEQREAKLLHRVLDACVISHSRMAPLYALV